MMVVLYFMRKETTQKMELEEISDPYQNILFYGLCLLFGVANLLRAGQRSIFPFLFTGFFLTLTNIFREYLLLKNIAISLPI